MKFGIAFEPTMPLNHVLKMAELAEQYNLDSLWVSDDNPTSPCGDVFETLTALALNTSEATLGTSVVNPYTRNPAMIASAVLALDRIAKDRVILGLGLGSKSLLKSIGVRGWGTPLRVMKTTVETFRRLFDGENVTVSCPGVFKVSEVQLRTARIPIYIGSRGPRMLALAGEIADGVLLTVRVNAMIPRTLRHIDIGMERIVGKKRRKFDITNSLVISVGRNRTEARGKAKLVVAYLVAWESEEILRELGINPAEQAKVRNALISRGESYASKFVTDKMVEEFSAAGDVKKCLSKSADQIQKGINHLIFCVPFGPDPIEAIENIGEEIIPQLRSRG